MVKNRQKLDEFERKLLREENLSYEQALAINEALLKEAISLGGIDSGNWMEDIEVDIKIARAVNGLG